MPTCRPASCRPVFSPSTSPRHSALPLFDPDNKNAAVGANAFPSRGNGLIGQDAAKPDVVVAANGGSDLIYLPNKDRAIAARVVDFLLAQDYVSGLFVDDSLGRYPGTLPLSGDQPEGPRCHADARPSW